MSRMIPVAAIDEIPEGTGIEVIIGDRVMAVYHVDGRVYAQDGICPHAGGPLGAGSLTGCIVTCPWHGWQFDVTTGRHCLNDRIQQTQYPAIIEDGRVIVEIPE